MKNRLSGSRLFNALIIIVILTLPLMYAGLFTWAYEKPMDNLSQIDAVVINQDKPTDATLASGKTLHLDLGNDLSKELFAEDAPGFHWIPAKSAEDAKKGLADGTYQVALWIPADLSKNLAQLSELKAPEKTTLKLETNDGINYLTGTMARSVALTLQNLVSEKGAGQFADNILLSLGDVHSGLDEASSGAGKLADGAGKLADGTEQLAAGTNKLTASVSEFASGSQRLDQAISQYTDGVHQVSAGAAKLDGSFGQFQSGANQLNDGLQEMAGKLNATGTGTLNDGLAQMMAKTSQGSNPADPTLVDGASQISAGATALNQGAGQLSAGGQRLVAGVEQLNQATKKVEGQLPQMQAGVAQLRSQFHDETAGGKPTIKTGTESLAAQLDPAGKGNIGAGSIQMAEIVKKVAVGCMFLGDSNLICKNMKSQLKSQNMRLIDLVKATDELENGIKQAHGGAQQLKAGIDQVYSQTEPLEANLQRGPDPKNPSTLADYIYAVDGATSKGTDSQNPTLWDGANGISAGSQELASGATRLAIGADAERAGILQLHGGIGKVQGAYRQINEGVNQASAGSSALANGANQIGDGIGQLNAGASRLDGNSAALQSGADRLYRGSLALQDGAGKLGAATEQIETGGNDLREGANTLSTKLADGAHKIPDLGADRSQNVADVAASPIKVDAVRANAVAENGVGFAPFFMCLAMWVGGIAIFLMLPALDRRRKPGELFFISALRSLLLTAPFAIAQSVFVVVGLELLLGLGAKDLALLFGVCIVTSLCFVILNQGFIALLGFRGRFVSVLMLLLQITSAGATFPVETMPKFFQVLHPLLPMTYCAAAIREYIAGANLPVFHGFWILMLWAALGLGMTLLGAWLNPGEKPLKHDPAFAFPGHAHAAAAS